MCCLALQNIVIEKMMCFFVYDTFQEQCCADCSTMWNITTVLVLFPKCFGRIVHL